MENGSCYLCGHRSCGEYDLCIPEEELNEGGQTTTQENYGLIQAFKLLLKNKFYMMICGTYILQQLYNAMIGAGIYYFTWVLGNKTCLAYLRGRSIFH